ncbi:MAG: glycosyltransferase family 4 protein [Candidatus Moranbacteria bacterium]|nr:glycosyltransferase family 4 protein [Candidatus Moranbacteria bacterium]
MKKAKILYIITQSDWGGAQKYVFDLANGLKGEFEVSVAFGGKGRLGDRLQAIGIRTHRLENLVREIHLWKDFLGFWEIYRLIRKERPDIVHTNSSKAEILGNIAARLAGVERVVFTAHGFVFNEDLGFWKKTFFIFWERLAGLFATRIICVSDFDRKSALKNKISPARKLCVIHNGIEIPAGNLARVERAGRKIIIGTIANFYYNKGLEFLVQAAAELNKKFPNLEFRVAGDGGERRNIEDAIKKQRLQNFKLLGFQEEQYDFLRQLDIFVLPSLKEGLPYALLEALSLGVPAVASKVGGIPEIISDGENGFLVEPKNSKMLAEKINLLLGDERLKAEFSRSGREKIQAEFSLGRMLARTQEAYIGIV